MPLMRSIEEKYLLGFFSDYEAYRSRTHIFIPFIPMVHLQLASFSVFFQDHPNQSFFGNPVKSIFLQKKAQLETKCPCFE